MPRLETDARRAHGHPLSPRPPPSRRHRTALRRDLTKKTDKTGRRHSHDEGLEESNRSRHRGRRRASRPLFPFPQHGSDSDTGRPRVRGATCADVVPVRTGLPAVSRHSRNIDGQCPEQAQSSPAIGDGEHHQQPRSAPRRCPEGPRLLVSRYPGHPVPNHAEFGGRPGIRRWRVGCLSGRSPIRN